MTQAQIFTAKTTDGRTVTLERSHTEANGVFTTRFQGDGLDFESKFVFPHGEEFFTKINLHLDEDRKAMGVAGIDPDSCMWINGEPFVWKHHANEAVGPTMRAGIIEYEIADVSAAMSFEQDRNKLLVLSIIYQTLMWSRAPTNFAMPSSMVEAYVKDLQ